jgi:hypothetical protein
LKWFEARVDEKANPLGPPKVRRKKFSATRPSSNCEKHLYRVFGVDLTTVPGINILTAHTIPSEIGPDISKFQSASAFCFVVRPIPA